MRKKCHRCQLLNFIVGQAKLAVYMSRKNMIERTVGQNVVVLLFALVKARILIDFNFYKSVNDLACFVLKWCEKGAVCSIVEGEVVFAQF